MWVPSQKTLIMCLCFFYMPAPSTHSCMLNRIFKACPLDIVRSSSLHGKFLMSVMSMRMVAEEAFCSLLQTGICGRHHQAWLSQQAREQAGHAPGTSGRLFAWLRMAPAAALRAAASCAARTGGGSGGGQGGSRWGLAAASCADGTGGDGHKWGQVGAGGGNLRQVGSRWGPAAASRADGTGGGRAPQLRGTRAFGMQDSRGERQTAMVCRSPRHSSQRVPQHGLCAGKRLDALLRPTPDAQ